MKLCTDCQHHRGCGWVDDDHCKRPTSDRKSPVDGRLVDRLDVYAHRERSSDKSMFGRVRCGPSARFFEPKG